MQSHLVFSLFLAAIQLVSSSSNDLVQATPEYQDQFSPACSQSLEVQQTTTENPDEVSRRTMTGLELIRGSLPVNRGTHGLSKLFSNALRNFFVHPDSPRRRYKRSSAFFRALFPPPPFIKPEDPQPNILPLPSSTRKPVQVTMPPILRSTSTQVPIKITKTNMSNDGITNVPENYIETTPKMLEKVGDISIITEFRSEGYTLSCNTYTFMGSLTFLCLIL